MVLWHMRTCEQLQWNGFSSTGVAVPEGEAHRHEPPIPQDRVQIDELKNQEELEDEKKQPIVVEEEKKLPAREEEELLAEQGAGQAQEVEAVKEEESKKKKMWWKGMSIRTSMQLMKCWTRQKIQRIWRRSSPWWKNQTTCLKWKNSMMRMKRPERRSQRRWTKLLNPRVRNVSEHISICLATLWQPLRSSENVNI